MFNRSDIIWFVSSSCLSLGELFSFFPSIFSCLLQASRHPMNYPRWCLQNIQSFKCRLILEISPRRVEGLQSWPSFNLTLRMNSHKYPFSFFWFNLFTKENNGIRDKVQYIIPIFIVGAECLAVVTSDTGSSIPNVSIQAGIEWLGIHSISHLVTFFICL